MKKHICKRRLRLLAALVLFSVLLTACGAQVAKAPASASTGQEVDDIPAGKWNEVVAEFGEHPLTNTELSYYYWTGYASFLGYYGADAKGLLDLYAPLDQQYYEDGVTWQDYFLENALTSFRQYCTIYDLAQKSQYAFSENALASLAKLESNLLENAQQMGYDSAQAYLKANYGPNATVESYRAFMRQYFTVMEYTYELQNQFSRTDAEITAYYDENQERYAARGIAKDDTPMADVRYVLVEPTDKSDGAYLTAEKTFDAMLRQWEAEADHSEAALMALGEAWFDEGAAQNYLEDTSPGGVELEGFDAWVFEDGRQAGDYTVLKNSYGFFLLYYVRTGESPYWYAQASYDMLYDDYTAFLDEKMALYPYAEHLERVVIAQVDGLYETQSNP